MQLKTRVLFYKGMIIVTKAEQTEKTLPCFIDGKNSVEKTCSLKTGETGNVQGSIRDAKAGAAKPKRRRIHVSSTVSKEFCFNPSGSITMPRKTGVHRKLGFRLEGFI